MPEVWQLLVDALLLHLHLEDLQRLLQVLLVHQLVEPSAHKIGVWRVCPSGEIR